MSSFLRALFPNGDKKPAFCTAIIAAAGGSTRMGGENKLLYSLAGRPVISYVLQALDNAPSVDEIVVAAREEDFLCFADICKVYCLSTPVKIVRGGATRTESVLRAALEVDERATLLLVQDGARPFVTVELIDRCVQLAKKHFAVAPAIPVHDTIKVAKGSVVQETPDRSTLFAVQTPQVFDASLLKAALTAAIENGAAITDDCSAVERLGKEVYLTEGYEENMKLTTPLDLVIAETIIEKRGN